jgi:hypothetical protein
MDSVTLILFILGFVLLIVGAEFLVRGASTLAIAVGISPLVVGLTVVAYGTSAPELAVTIDASLAGQIWNSPGEYCWEQYLKYYVGSGPGGNRWSPCCKKTTCSSGNSPDDFYFNSGSFDGVGWQNWLCRWSHFCDGRNYLTLYTLSGKAGRILNVFIKPMETPLNRNRNGFRMAPQISASGRVHCYWVGYARIWS